MIAVLAMRVLRPACLPALAALVGLYGCVSATPAMLVPRSVGAEFEPTRDGLAYANELYWEYLTRAGRERRRPASSGARGGETDVFAQRCPMMVRQVRQFFYGARFDPSLPRVASEEYGRLIDRVFASDSRSSSRDPDPVVIPGFSNLHQFSAEHEELFKQRTPSRWRSYAQRGNWRMIYPFLPGHQHRTAESLLASLAEGHPPIVHVLNFPEIDINHMLLVYRGEATEQEIRFFAYDPNQPRRPVVLRWDREHAVFEMPARIYFEGGPVKVYEAYDGWLY